MRRPVWLRVLIALWGVWFSAALVEAPGLHVCPVHGGHAAHAATDTHSAHAHGLSPGAGEMAGMPDHSRHAPGECTCLSQCCCATPVGVPTRAVELSLVDQPAITPIATCISAPIIRPDRSQPFANGPPVA